MKFRQKGDNLRKDLFPDKPLGPCPRVWEPGNANTAPTLGNRLVGRVGDEMRGRGEVRKSSNAKFHMSKKCATATHSRRMESKLSGTSVTIQT
jgi:hypothetical protein